MSEKRAELELRNRAEIERSAVKASKIDITAQDVVRYISPRSDTVYPLEYAFHLLGDVRGKRVLDLGCGSGENTVPLLMRGAEVIAIDISPEMISAAGKRLATACGIAGRFGVRHRT